MRAIRSLLGLDSDPVRTQDDADTATVRRIARELDRMDPDEARSLAAFAYVLARVANADLDVREEEVREMERIVAETGGLTSAQAALVVQIARLQATRRGGTEDYLVTRQYRELSTREQRLGLIRCLFAIAAADASITQDENAVISQIGNELGLTPREVTAIRGGFREHLAALRPTAAEKRRS
ncbi:MAG: TerB family tellurite resistance protein [Myxococcota bacterium]